MTWKKFFTKIWQFMELIAELEPSKEEKKRRLMQEVEGVYDSAYYSGNMSYSLSEAYKDEFRYSLGLKK